MSREVVVIFTGSSSEIYHPDGGGIQVAEYSFCEGVRDADWKVTAIVGTNENDYDKEKPYHANVLRIPTQSFKQGGMADVLPFAYQASSIAAKYDAESNAVLHFTSVIPALTFFNNQTYDYLVENGRLKAKTVYTLHNYHYGIADQPLDIFAKYPAEWQFLHQAEQQVVAKADRVLTTADNYTDYLSRKFGREILYVPNTIGERNRFPVRKIQPTDFDVILSLSRLAEGKNLDLLLDSFALALQENNRLRLILAGDGELSTQLKQQSAALELNPGQLSIGFTENDILDAFKTHNIIFTDRVSAKQKSTVLNTANVFAQLSTREVSPLVGLENMVYGNSIVATEIPGWLDFKDRGASVHLFSPDAEVVAEGLLYVAALHRQDPELAKLKNVTAYDTYFAPNVVIPFRLAIYNELLKK